MKRILLVGRRDHGEKNDLGLLAESMAAQEGVAVRAVYFEDFVFYMEGKDTTEVRVRTGQDLQSLGDFDLVMLFHWTGSRVYGDIAHALALFMDRRGITFWNREALSSRTTTKLSQLMHLALENVHIPRSVFSLDHGLLAAESRDRGLDKLVCKDVTASRGRRNFLVPDLSSLQEVLADLKDQPMVAQEYIENDRSDYRFFMAGGKLGIVIRRTGSEGSHLTNISAGGEAEIVTPDTIPAGIIAEAEKIANLFERELCGIDYMYDISKNRFVFLEINGTPQIVNGVFVTEKIKALTDVINQERFES